MQTNTPLSDQVISAIAADPRMSEPSEVAVEAYGDVVTLRGTVESFAQRRAAVADAKKVDGVSEVDDHLKVNLLGDWKRGDDQIRGIALQNLAWDVDVPSDLVDVKVEEGWVTLKGKVAHQYQSDAAYEDVASLYGVVGVTNEVKVMAI
jgi:osmotically-inducible protein OsmY